MKPTPTRVSSLEPRSPLERLRARAQGTMSRLGNWGKRLLASGPAAEPADPARHVAETEDARTQRASTGESPRRQEREQPSAAAASRPVRRATPARLAEPLRSQRPYLTEPLAEGLPRHAESGSAALASAPTDRSDSPAERSTQVASGAQPAPLAQQGTQSAPPTPEQAEEMRRALARKLLRGTRNGMLLTLAPEYIWSQVLEVLATRLAEASTFFQGAVLSLDTRHRPLEPQEIEELRALLAPYEMTFKEVGSDQLNDPRILPSGAARAQPAGETAPTLAIRASDVTRALFTRRTIRSGQRLRYESSVVIMGDVNSGAEVIAGGDVVVWGTLRGTVHAGYPGNEEAVVCALVLAPVHLRIGALASRPPEDGGLPPPMPEVASVKNGQIVVESWNAGRASRR